MAAVAVRKREGYLAVASSAPLALHYLGHPHDVLPFCRDEYLWMADLALEPPCVYPVGVFNVVNEVALCGYYDVKVQRGHLFIFGVKRPSGLYHVLFYYLRPVNEPVFIMGKP